jgi:hypothetical protein
MEFWQKIKNLFNHSNPSKKTSIMEEKMIGLVKMVANTKEVELSCDEVFELLDQYAEMVLRGEDVSEFMPDVKHHLDLCGECKEEYEVLYKILEATEA